jgi:spore coat protein U-like protein
VLNPSTPFSEMPTLFGLGPSKGEGNAVLLDLAPLAKIVPQWRKAMRLRELGKCIAMGAIAAAIPISSAVAQTASTSFQVTANVDSSCVIEATDLNFGAYSPVGPALDGQSQLLLLCTSSAQWNVGLDQGTAAGATVTTRQMTGPAPSLLSYSLFSDAARTINWGNTVGTDTVSGVGTGGPQVVTIYGRVPAAQNVGVGGYQDTITATVTF